MGEVIVRHLTKKFGDVVAVDDVSIKVEDGEFLVLLGPSGCGKSTILRLIAGLEDATAGEISIAGKLVNFVDPVRRNVAMVFQNYALYPHLTVHKNIAFPLEMARKPKPEIETAVKRAATTLELDALLGRYPDQLSGGQRQRVALARAIVREPQAFLMDEPLSNLDALLRVQTRVELMQLHRKLGTTTLYVTHDQVEAMTMGHRIAVMRDGVVQQLGAPNEVYRAPANAFVATFIGAPAMNLLPGRLVGEGGAWRFAGEGFAVDLDPVALGATPARLADAAGDGVRLGVRPEAFRVTAAGSGRLDGEVQLLEPVGSDLFLSVGVSGTVLQVRTGPDDPTRVGERIGLDFELGKCHVFDAQGRNVRYAAEEVVAAASATAEHQREPDGAAA